jgi:hypothetical protein
LSGLKRDAIGKPSAVQPDCGAVAGARAGEDDFLELLDGRRGDRRIDPLAVRSTWRDAGDAQRVGAQIAVEDGTRHLDPLVGELGLAYQSVTITPPFESA